MIKLYLKKNPKTLILDEFNENRVKQSRKRLILLYFFLLNNRTYILSIGKSKSTISNIRCLVTIRNCIQNEWFNITWTNEINDAKYIKTMLIMPHTTQIKKQILSLTCSWCETKTTKAIAARCKWYTRLAGTRYDNIIGRTILVL